MDVIVGILGKREAPWGAYGDQPTKKGIMKKVKIVAMVALILLIGPSAVAAGDFDWMRDFSAQETLDPSGFRARLASRFQIGEAKISAVLGNMPNPADAYMALRLGELSHQPPERLMEEHNKNKGKGWGVMAKNLGIKPGSAEFKALKSGHDLDKGGKGRVALKDQSKAQEGRSKGKDKGGKSKQKGGK